MHPEVEEYFKIAAEAQEVFVAAEKIALDRFNEENKTAIGSAGRDRPRLRYNATVNAHQSLRIGTVDLAWSNLMDSDDKLVSFIARNCAGYRNDSEPYALVILKLLPAPLEQIKKTAVDGGWCSVFDQFMQQAIREGAVKDTRSQARRDMERWVQGNIGARYWTNNIMPFLDQILDQEAEAYVAAQNGTAPVVNAKGEPVEASKAAAPEPAQPIEEIDDDCVDDEDEDDDEDAYDEPEF